MQEDRNPQEIFYIILLKAGEMYCNVLQRSSQSPDFNPQILWKNLKWTVHYSELKLFSKAQKSLQVSVWSWETVIAGKEGQGCYWTNRFTHTVQYLKLTNVKNWLHKQMWLCLELNGLGLSSTAVSFNCSIMTTIHIHARVAEWVPTIKCLALHIQEHSHREGNTKHKHSLSAFHEYLLHVQYNMHIYYKH